VRGCCRTFQGRMTGERDQDEMSALRCVTHLSHWTIVILICLMTFGTIVQAHQQDVLDNGQVRLIFDEHTGLFSAYSLQGGGLRLLNAGPGFGLGGLQGNRNSPYQVTTYGKSFSAENATGISVSRQSFKDPLGQLSAPGRNIITSAGLMNIKGRE